MQAAGGRAWNLRLKGRIMKTSTYDRSELMSGIKTDAIKEADLIIEEANRTASDKQLARDMQVKSIIRETERKIELQTGIIEKNCRSAISVEKKRISLKIREKVINSVIDLVRKKIAEKAEDPDYPEIVKGWIIEAAIGLGEKEAVVNGSIKENGIITEQFLRETEKKYHALTGGTIRLIKSDKNPLLGQGVVLSSVNNKTAFNNQVPTRIMRYQAEIRKTIYREFFA